jgi:serine/threonine-protein kinase
MPATLPRLTDALTGRYTIEREIGAGGMALVYLAEDLKHGRQVAIKVLKPELGATLGADRFLREIEIAARLTHPHIVPLFDSGAAGDLLYYVMPYVPGESLRSRLARERQLPVEEALRLTREASFTATSSRRTCSSPTASPSSPTSASPGPCDRDVRMATGRRSPR